MLRGVLRGASQCRKGDTNMSQTTTVKPFAPLAPVDASAVAKADKLTQDERDALLCAINGTRLGLFTFSVAVTYDKQTDAKARIEGADYLGLPGTTCKLHLGTLTG